MKINLTRTALKTFAKTFAKDDEGATAIEYGLFAALVGAVIVVAVSTLGQQTNVGFTTISDEMTDAGIVAPSS